MTRVKFEGGWEAKENRREAIEPKGIEGCQMSRDELVKSNLKEELLPP